MKIANKREQRQNMFGYAEREQFGAKLRIKNIFKSLAFAMLMPAMLLTTACSTEDTVDDFITPTNENTETVSTKGYALPVTVNVTREGDDTRATYNDGTRKLSFSAGDKLFVRGSSSYYEAGKFAGTLDYVPESGKFSGIIYTQYEWTGTAHDLFKSVSYPSATLLPAGYENYGYFAIEEDEYAYEANVVCYPTKAFALTKVTAIEQFSYEGANTYDNGFALSPQNPILNFTITDLPVNKEVDVVFSYYIAFSSYLYTFDKKVTTDGSGNATFAIALGGTYDLSESSLTVDGNTISITNGSEKLVRGGKVYGITRSQAIRFDNPFNEEKYW